MKYEIGKWYNKYYDEEYDNPGLSYFSPIKYTGKLVYFHEIFIEDDGNIDTTLNVNEPIDNWFREDDPDVNEGIEEPEDYKVIIEAIFK